MSQEAKQSSKRGSVIVIAALLAVALVGAIAIWATGALSAGSPLMVKVTVYGEVVDLFPLDTDKTQTYLTDDGTNTVVIEGGKVHIEKADCPGGDCMKQGTISSPSHMLVCLPHQLIVEIVTADGKDAPSQFTGSEIVGEDGIDTVLN